MTNEFYNKYALRKDSKELVNIEDVENGKRCGCVCPSCGNDLIAKKGNIKEHHFAHLSKTVCEYAYETALHYLAKEIIASSKSICLPKDRYCNEEIITQLIELNLKSILNPSYRIS